MKFYIFSISVLLFIVFASCNNNSSHNKYEEEPCPECRGKGYINTYCPECNGKGSVIISCSECGGWGHKTHYVSGTRPKPCPTCYGTSIARCQICEGTNMCNSCSGEGYFQCTVCKGYGVIVFDEYDTDTWIKCNNCESTGYEKCLICGGRGKCTACDNGIGNCQTCWGTGRYGRENYSETLEVECVYCNGSGNQQKDCYDCNGTGKVREICNKCNGEGTVFVESYKY